MPRRLLCAVFALAAIAPAASAEDYLGILKPPKSSLEAPTGIFSLSAAPLNGLAPSLGVDSGMRMKLGYKYSRYFAVQGEFVDFGTGPALFASPSNLASAFRSTGFGVDTVATLPWRSFSFYGKLGAYRGEARNEFVSYSTALLADGAMRGTRWRYGLGVRYDFTPSFGIRADLERYSPLGTPLASDGGDTDSVTVGVTWRF